MDRIIRISAVFFLCSGLGCVTGPNDGPTNPKGGPSGGTGPALDEPPFTPSEASPNRLGSAGKSPSSSNDPGNTFEHPDLMGSSFDALARMQEEGPPEIASRLHGCQKIGFGKLGRVLMGLGVDISQNSMFPAAGAIWMGSAQALGAPNYAARIPESIALTTAGATKLFDIFVQAAPEIIQNMPNVERCKLKGLATSMFDAQGQCTLNGISCLQGFLATTEQKALCDRVITQASSPAIGRTIAVASILAAAHTCE